MGNVLEPITLHKYLYANSNPVNGIDPSGHMTLLGLLTNTKVMSTLSVVSAGLSGYSIGSGGLALYEGRYADGALDIGFGFMGTGIATTSYKLIKFTFGPVNRAIRVKYNTFVKIEMPQFVKLWKQQGKSLEQIADQLIIMRNSIKIETRAMMEAEGWAGRIMKKVIERRNTKIYGHPAGPDRAYYTSKGKSAEDIIGSAIKTDEKINIAIGTRGVL